MQKSKNMQDSFKGLKAGLAGKPYTPNFPGKPVKPMGKFYKNLTNVKGQTSPMRAKAHKVLKKKGLMTNYSK